MAEFILRKTLFYLHRWEDRDGKKVNVVFTDLGPFKTANKAYNSMETVERQPDGTLLASTKPEFRGCLPDTGRYLTHRSSKALVFEPFHKENET